MAWISIKKKRPRAGRWVHVKYRIPGDKEYQHDIMFRSPWRDKENGFYFPNCFVGHGWLGDEVTHWQPLYPIKK